MKVNIVYNEEDVKRLIMRDLIGRVGVEVKREDVTFEVQTKENYRATAWEHGRFRARIDKEET